MTDRLDVGFVPAECPGADATGAVHTSTLLVRELSQHHDCTVYVASQFDADERDLPARDRVEYVLHDDLPSLPHPLTTKVDALREEVGALGDHDLVHAYSSAFLPVLADVDAPTLQTLNSYVPVCPKGDLRFRGAEKCSGPAPAKCVGCVAATAASRRQGVETEARAAYDALGRLGFVRENVDRSDEVTAYHALSPHLVDDYAALGFPREDTTVVPHFYEASFADAAAAASGENDHPTLLYVGGLQHIKGVDVLVRALARLEDARLRIAGRGPYEQALRRLADRLGVGHRITWLGYVDHDDALPGEYARADAFVYPGRIDEPFGRVLLEALASRTPVVATDVGSTDYIVGDAGERVPADDPRALAAACRRVLDAPDRYEAAIPDQLARFSRADVVSRYLRLYESVLDGAGSP